MDPRTTLIAAAAAVMITVTAGIAYTVTHDGGNDRSVSDDSYISFFFYDNYEYDMAGNFKSDLLANGFWVKGYGDTKKECFLDACESAGIFVEMNGHNIVKLGIPSNGTYDTNFFQSGWADGEWDSTITLGSDEPFKVRYMAITHGRLSGGRIGTIPEPWQNPDEMIWCYGESPEPGNGTGVRFFFYDSYENAEPANYNLPYLSNIWMFIADGYWVTGYGETVKDAFRDACTRVFGAGTTIIYDRDTGMLARIGNISSDMHTFVWNGNGWDVKDISDMTLTEGMCIAVGHCPGSTGQTLPFPPQTPDEARWIL